MFVLAHISDPHLAPLPAPRAEELIGKRGLGYINWRRKRGAVHRPEILEAIVADLKAQRFDHLAITGDLINLALPVEFVHARDWLESMGAPDEVTLVPGNHDVYVRDTAAQGEREWGAYMRGDELEAFPFVRRRGHVALIGLSTALPTAPFLATGQLGTGQIAAFEKLSTDLGREGLFRVVLLHHPPASKLSRYLKRLTDGAEFRACLRRCGAEMLIHGHDHKRSLTWFDGPNRLIPAVGVPSASAACTGADEPAGYRLFEIDGKSGAWHCTMITRGYSTSGDILELERRPLYGYEREAAIQMAVNSARLPTISPKMNI